MQSSTKSIRSSIARSLRFTSTVTRSEGTLTNPKALLASLQSLRIQPSQYAKVHLYNKAYIITKGDTIHLPVRLRETKVGDMIKITHASSVGSRDYTIRGAPYVEESLFTCRAVVTEHTKQPMVTTIKKKRRQRHAKAIKNKQPYTVLRITELDVKAPPESA